MLEVLFAGEADKKLDAIAKIDAALRDDLEVAPGSRSAETGLPPGVGPAVNE